MIKQKFSDRRQEQIIEKLYAVNDEGADILPLQPALCETSEGLLDDVEALLRDPRSRTTTEARLRQALKEIAQDLL